MGANAAVKLEVFVKKGCDSCERAHRMAEQVDAEFPSLAVEVVDISTSPTQRDDVFAVPTFVLQGRILSLGNPQESTLHEEITKVLRG